MREPFMERRVRGLVFLAALAAVAADFPAKRPDGEPPGTGSQRLMVAALQRAHMNFSADACVASVEALLFRTLDFKRPSEDDFDFVFRSPSLSKMRYEAKICLPYASGAAPQCSGEWQYEQGRSGDAPRCLPGRPIDTAEALLSARKHGLAPAPIDGMRASLRLVPKKGQGLARNSRLRGKFIWLIESRDVCHAVDAKTADHLLKAPCKSLGWPES